MATLKYVEIQTEISEYEPQEVSNTLTVRELISRLKGLDGDLPVILAGGRGFGGIEDWDVNVEEFEYDDDEDEYEEDEE